MPHKTVRTLIVIGNFPALAVISVLDQISGHAPDPHQPRVIRNDFAIIST
jgi:hypothetical protein